MTERVRRLFEYHFAENNGIGVTKRTVGRIVKKVANKAGIAKPVSPHVLRHTFSVNCIKKGISTCYGPDVDLFPGQDGASSL